jgi:(S)-2-hydroxy-acid oxidase
MELVCVKDFEEQALCVLDRNSRNYFKSGADDEITIRQNQEAFNRLIVIVV